MLINCYASNSELCYNDQTSSTTGLTLLGTMSTSLGNWGISGGAIVVTNVSKYQFVHVIVTPIL